jgi:RimJ/RimL family protein N-acetyltransferase
VLEPTYPLRTERLDLRPYQEDDVEFLHELQSDPELTRYLYYGPMTREEVQLAFGMKRTRHVLRGEGDALQLVAVSRETGERVGEATLFWTSEPHRGGEVGYLVHPAHQGRGYATEMGGEMLRLAFEDFGWHRVIGRLDARNAASARVLERLGMRREAHLVSNEYVKGEWCDELDYAVLADEWRASRSSPVEDRPGVTGPA